MRLYVCYGTFGPVERHACGRAYAALRAAGHAPDVERTYGCFGTDRLFPGRHKVNRMTGNYKVPTLVLDDDTIIDGSQNIAAWAVAHPALGASAPASRARAHGDRRFGFRRRPTKDPEESLKEVNEELEQT